MSIFFETIPPNICLKLINSNWVWHRRSPCLFSTVLPKLSPFFRFWPEHTTPSRASWPKHISPTRPFWGVPSSQPLYCTFILKVAKNQSENTWPGPSPRLCWSWKQTHTMNIKNNYHIQSIPKGTLEKHTKPGRSQKQFTHQHLLPNSTTTNTVNRRNSFIKTSLYYSTLKCVLLVSSLFVADKSKKYILCMDCIVESNSWTKLAL